MGFGDKVKDVYFSAEEKWYGMLDKLDEHVPVYKVVDKVDQVVPSFALFIIIIIILLLLIGIGIFGITSGTGGDVVLQLTIVDNSGNAISGAEVTLAGIDETYYSNDFGLIEDITLSSIRSIEVTATKGDKTKDKTIYLTESPQLEEIKLPLDQINFDSMTALFMTETGQRINDRLNLSYRCTSGNGTPADDVIYNGSANINVSSACGTLSVTITSEKYETTTKTIANSSETFRLVEKIPAQMVTMSVQLKSNDTLITEPVSVKAYRMNNLYLPADTVISANGVATFTLQEGNYKFSTTIEHGYRDGSASNVAITTGMQPVVIDLTKSVIGSILISAKRGSIQIADAFISLTRSGTEINTGDTNDDGEILFEVADTGPYTITATKEGYCSETQTGISVGDTVNIDLTTDTGNCGGTLLVRVLDQDNKPVQYARTIIFGEKAEDSYKLGHVDKLTDYNGEAEWEPVNYSETGESYRIFAFKGSYTGWSTLRDFSALNESEAFTVKLNIPLGTVNVLVKDKDGDPITFSDQEPVYVRLYEDFGNNPVSGKKIIEDPNGLISFVTKAGRRVYAVVEKNGYQSHMTLPKEVVGDGTLNFEVTLYRPPIDELYVNYLGLYKNGSQVLKVEPGQEYEALFELVAPKDYDELGIFVRVGRNDYTKTELDKIYIEEIIAPGAKDLMRGATYNPPKGYSTDQKYLNQDESKWAQAIWNKNGFVQGRIMVAAKVKIRENATVEEQLTIAYRAWGIFEGSYERDIQDDVLGTSASNSTKQELYAATKEAYTTVGMETLCEESGERAFCITSTYTDPEGLTNSFDTTFDAKNSSEYNLFIKIMNASSVGFDIAKVKLENDEENLYLGNYSLYTPTNEYKTGLINGNDSEWIETNNYTKNSSITFNELKVTPSTTGYGSLKLRIRDEKTILFEKIFGINIASNKKMRAEYMYNSNFQNEVPKLVSGKVQTLTVRAKNNANGLEISSAMIKLYDRFGNKLTEKVTNSLGTASITIPASLPSEKLTIKIEKADYETYVEEIMISEDIVEVTPATLGFTVNPQTKTEETKTIKIENKTGFDLTIKEIILTGKFKGKLNESQIQSWLYNYSGTTIASDDYEEINLKIISSSSVTVADDLTGVFQITVTNGYTEWVKEVDATIRVGLGKDADDPNCLTITQNSWTDTTQGEQVSIGFEVMNNCTVDGTPIPLKNLAAKDAGTGNILGTFSVQSDATYSEVVRGFPRTFQTQVTESEIVPITLSFIADGGVNGQTTGSIIFQAINETDSKDQVLQTSISYSIDAINLQECITIGADLIRMTEEETGSFSVTNNCPGDTYFEVDSQLMTSDDKFTLTSGETKEVSLTGGDDEVGAFNTLVYAREGSNSIELIDNVKTIIDPDGGCFELSRYEFDIYDAADDDYDGADVAVLKNSCTEKNVATTVEGTEPYDTDNLMQSAVLGALAGWIGSDFALTGNSNNNANDQSQRNRNNQNNLSGGAKLDAPPSTPASRKLTLANQNLETRYRQAASEISSLSSTYRTPTNVAVEARKLAEETIATLEKERDLLASDTKLVRVWYKLYIGRSPTALPGSAEEQITTQQQSLAEDINSRIQDINNARNAIGEALDTFTGTLNQAISSAKQDLDSHIANGRQKIREGNLASTGVEDYVASVHKPGTKKISDAYTANVGEFNSTVNEKIELIRSKIDATQIGHFLVAVEAAEKQIDDASIKAQDKLYDTNDFTAKKLTKNKTKLISQYNKKVRRINNTNASLLAEKTKAEADKVKKEGEYTAALQNKTAAEAKKAEYASVDTIIGRYRFRRANSALEGAFNIIARVKTTTQTEDYSYKSATFSEDPSTVISEKIIEAGEIAFLGKKIVIIQKDIDQLVDINNALKPDHEEQIALLDEAISATDTKEKQKKYSTHIKSILEKAKISIETIDRKWDKLAENLAETDSQKVEELAKVESGVVDADSLVEANPSAETITVGGEIFTLHENGTSESGEPLYIASNSNDERAATGTLQQIRSEISQNQQAIENNFLEREARCHERADTIVDGRQVVAKYNRESNFNCSSYNHSEIQFVASGNFYFSGGIGTCCIPTEDGTDFTVLQGGATGVSSTKTEGAVTTEFLLSTTGSSTATSQTSANSSSGILNGYTTQILGTITAWNSGSLLSGAALSALIELTQASDTLIDEGYTFIVDYVTIGGVTLDSPDGIALTVGDSTYDYDDFYTSTTGGSGYNISNEDLATSYTLIEEKELTFTNPSGLKSATPYQPFEAILTVTGTENVYDDEYDYAAIRAAAILREDYEESDAEWYEFWDVSETEIADMEEEDLTVDETRTIEKKFHLLFNSYEYTTTIDPVVIGNCTVGAKTGSTGPDAMPKILLDWDWSNIAMDQCDETNADYDYCDTTQFTTTLLKKVSKMKEFFRTNSLGECPQSIDIAGSKTQTLSTIGLDVGITQIQATDSGAGAKLEVIVSTNNSLPMDIDLEVKVYQVGTTNVKFSCSETQSVTSTGTFYCDVDTATAGTGTFDVVSTITPTLCDGCENTESSNDVMNSQLAIGQAGVQDCLYYKTQKDYFEDVLAANGKLSSQSGQDMLGYLNFTVNLVRDGFSNDFKADFDSYLNTFTTKPTVYTDLQGLFSSNKFNVNWPEKPGAWEAGKYNVTIIVEFEEDNWTWNDDNDIKSIDVQLNGWSRPDVSHAIYDVGFNGEVGVGTDNGRLGYGVNFTQLSEEPLTIVGSTIATHHPSSNALSEVRVDVDKDFYTMNTNRRGNVLTISTSGNKTNLILSPSTAVPLLLDVTRDTARDAYAFYTVEVNGQPQTTGSSLITWNGIGNGCVDFDGSGMSNWDNAPDTREGSGNGYGLGGSVWTNATFSGTASFYGTFYAPDGSSTVIYFTRQSEDAVFTSDQGSGDLITIDTSSGISSLADVFNKVGTEEVCVIGGEYFWNSGTVYAPIEADILSRSNSCITTS